jgi:hypothetical protein
MNEKTGLLQRSIETLRHNGLIGLSQKAALYLARRMAWRSDAWSKSLDFKISRDYLLREYGSLIKRNEIFRDRHKGQRCFVIGNGPSLKKQDLAPLANEITLVTNSFYLHPIVGEQWQPSYYFFSDPAYFNDSPVFAGYETLTSRIRCAPFFVPHFARDFLVTTKALPPKRTYFVAAWSGLEKESWRAKPDLTNVTPGMQTVVQLAIMAAMYMGCSQVYLLGLDHDWLSHGGEHVNFYSEHDAENQPAGNINGWEYKPLMESVLVMWQIYEGLERSACAEGIKIINATRGGFLDVFERETYESVVAEGTPVSKENAACQSTH